MPITINGSGTITGISAGGLPDAIITQPELAAGVVGNGPAFSAYQTSSQTPTSAVFTKVSFQNKSNTGLSWDTNNSYDNTTNYRFQPTIAGYYQINSGVNFAVTAGITLISIFKNGTEYKRSQQFNILASTGGNAYGNTISGQVYLNGSTDYVEIFLFMTSGAATSADLNTFFDGAMVRAA